MVLFSPPDQVATTGTAETAEQQDAGPEIPDNISVSYQQQL